MNDAMSARAFFAPAGKERAPTASSLSDLAHARGVS
jgi:hypothetical protein